MQCRLRRSLEEVGTRVSVQQLPVANETDGIYDTAPALAVQQHDDDSIDLPLLLEVCG